MTTNHIHIWQSTTAQSTQQQWLFGNYHISMVLLYVDGTMTLTRVCYRLAWGWTTDWHEGELWIGWYSNHRLLIPQLQIIRYPNYRLTDTPTTDYWYPTTDWLIPNYGLLTPQPHHNLPPNYLHSNPSYNPNYLHNLHRTTITVTPTYNAQTPNPDWQFRTPVS